MTLDLFALRVGWSCRRGWGWGGFHSGVGLHAGGRLCREQLCQGVVGDSEGSLELGGVAYVGFLWFFLAGYILFCRKWFGVARHTSWDAGVAFSFLLDFSYHMLFNITSVW